MYERPAAVQVPFVRSKCFGSATCRLWCSASQKDYTASQGRLLCTDNLTASRLCKHEPQAACLLWKICSACIVTSATCFLKAATSDAMLLLYRHIQVISLAATDRQNCSLQLCQQRCVQLEWLCRYTTLNWTCSTEGRFTIVTVHSSVGSIHVSCQCSLSD